MFIGPHFVHGIFVSLWKSGGMEKKRMLKCYSITKKKFQRTWHAFTSAETAVKEI